VIVKVLFLGFLPSFREIELIKRPSFFSSSSLLFFPVFALAGVGSAALFFLFFLRGPSDSEEGKAREPSRASLSPPLPILYRVLSRS